MLSAHPLALSTDVWAGMQYAKTPARTTRGNNARAENAMRHAPMTVHGKGKAAQVRTPFHPKTIQARKIAQSSKSFGVVARPLGDKTPFPNRQFLAPLRTPAPETDKLAKLSLIDDDDTHDVPAGKHTPGVLLRPSSMRKSLRAPSSSSAQKATKFQTPVTNGNHWDVSDMDIDVEMGDAEAQPVVREDDYDEIEYMPPKLPERPYEPPFDMPDYKTLAKAFLQATRSDLYDDFADRYYAADIETQIDTAQLLRETGAFNWESLPLPELEDDDDPFRMIHTPLKEKTPLVCPPRPRVHHPIPHSPIQATSERPPVPPTTRTSSRPAPNSGLTTRSSSRTMPGSATRNAVSTPAPRPGGSAKPASTTTSAAAASLRRPTTSAGVRAPVGAVGAGPSRPPLRATTSVGFNKVKATRTTALSKTPVVPNARLRSTAPAKTTTPSTTRPVSGAAPSSASKWRAGPVIEPAAPAAVRRTTTSTKRVATKAAAPAPAAALPTLASDLLFILNYGDDFKLADADFRFEV